MKANQLSSRSLLTVLVLSGLCFLTGSFVSPSFAVAGTDHRVILYYFHGNYRCSTCTTIERLSHEAVFGNFQKALKDGTLVFEIVNLEKPANAHFVDEFDLFTKSLVLVEEQDGKVKRHKNLNRIWVLARDDDAFKKYVRDEITQFMQKAGIKAASDFRTSK